MKDKILIFIITYRASYRVKKVVEKIPFRYLKKKNFKIYIKSDIELYQEKCWLWSEYQEMYKLCL